MILATAMMAMGCQQKKELAQAEEKEVTNRVVGVEEFEKLIADTSQVVILDVRTDKEILEEEGLEGALHIDVGQDHFRDKCKRMLPKGKTVAVYCRNGFRSHTAGKLLNEVGFDAVDLRGGLVAWKEKHGTTANNR